ncbi:MAG: hypothetical protein V7L02_12390 [Nostoc sp.]
MNYHDKCLMISTTIAYAVTNGIQAKGERGKYTTERIKFYSTHNP